MIGGGITGAGIALDAASRGLRTVLVERRDLAHGTSRWSSKLVHGGLRYLATGQFGIAHESAAERHLLMTRIAPHLTRPLAQVMPLYAPGHMARGAYVGVGFGLGDGLRRLVGTPDAVLHAPGPIGRERTLRLAPAVRAEGLRGGVRGWDGQLFDDARLVVAVARTAAGFGASVLTRVEAVSVRGDGAVLRDVLTGEDLHISARAVLSATGVWAGELDADVHLRPSRGTHLVVESSRLGGSEVSLTVPVAGSSSRFVFTVPAPHGRSYIGITDVPADGPLPEVPHASETEIELLLETVNTVLERPLERSEVIATFAGLRPLLTGAAGRRRGDERPVASSRDPRIVHRRAERRGRQAHHLPPHGPGRGGCRRRPSVRAGRGRGIRHARTAARGRMAAGALGRDRGAGAPRAPLRRRGPVRRRSAAAGRMPLAG